MTVVTKKFFLVEWVIPTGCTPEDWSVGLRANLLKGSKFYGVAATKSVRQGTTVWVGRVVATVAIDEHFTPQLTFEMVVTSVSRRGGLTATWSEIESGDPKFEQRAYIWLTTNKIESFFGDWVEGQSERFLRTRLLNPDLWEELDSKLITRESKRDHDDNKSWLLLQPNLYQRITRDIWNRLCCQDYQDNIIIRGDICEWIRFATIPLSIFL